LTALPEPSPLWAPAYSVASYSDKTLGPNVTDFAATLLKASRGFRVGQPLEFTNWQSWLLDRLLELDPITGLMRYRRAIIGLPRKNGKSLLGTTLALEHTLYTEGAQTYSAASDRNQAKIVFGEARQQVINSPELSRMFKVYRDVLEVPSKGSVYRALSADAMRAHGLGPSMVIADELHAWSGSGNSTRGEELWEALTTGSADRPESLVVGITTAGGNTDTLLGRLYEHGRRVASSEAGIEDKAFGFWWWEASQEDDPTDPETWRKSNPNLAEGLLDTSDFDAAVSSAGSAGFAGFQRYRLNQWVRLAGQDFISPHHYVEAKRDESIPLGATICAGFDGSVSGDSTGLVMVDVETGTISVMAVWEPDPQNPEWTVDRAEVNLAVAKMFEEYNVVKLWCDPSFYEPDVLEWSKTWRNRVERIPPTTQRMAPLAQQFVADLVASEIGGDQDPRLERHILNAVATESGSFRKEKKNSPRKIDLLACAVLANGARHASKGRTQKTERRRAVIL